MGEAFGTVGAAVLLLTVIILVAPRVAERFRIPGLVGLIAGGMIVGPFVFDLVSPDGLIAALGAIGLLYLMFLAGLGFNLGGFAKHKAGAIAYGLLGFALPFSLAIAATMGLLDYTFAAAALVGAMWASNTLVAYPEAQAAGLTDNRAVGVAVSAGVIADILSLTVLALVTSSFALEAEGPEVTASNPDPTLPLWLGIPLLVWFALWALPRVSSWFFTEIGHTRTQRFVFVLAGMAAGALVAGLGGIEGLVGAFLAGLGMNRLIPSRGPLMRQIEFFGEALFVPAFLVSVGLSIDPRALFDLDTVLLGIGFAGIVVVGKSAAAVVVGALSRMSFAEIGVMATLSFGQAASTLAISQVGVELGIFDQEVVNAAVVAIVITAFLTSYGTRFFASRVEAPVTAVPALGSRVLVDARADAGEVDLLMKLAGAIAAPDDGLVVPFSVASGAGRNRADLEVERAVASAAGLGMDTEGTVRVGESFASDTLNLIDEHQASLLLLRWRGVRFPADYVIDSQIDAIGRRSTVPTVAAHLVAPWQRLVVVLGDMSVPWRHEDAALTVEVARRVHKAEPVPLSLFATIDPGKILEGLPEIEVQQYAPGRRTVLKELEPGDLLLVPAHVSRLAARVSRPIQRQYLRGISVAVIAGPGRLTVGSVSVRHPLHGTVNQRA